tara:strand:+ start:1802 stop:4855 length:3054 start_codon:yes stop_codon:yes gene_type:complete
MADPLEDYEFDPDATVDIPTEDPLEEFSVETPSASYDMDKLTQAVSEGMDDTKIIDQMLLLGDVITLPSGQQFRLRDAYEAGESALDISKTLQRGELFDESRGAVGATTAGLNTGLAQYFLGAPVDLMQGAVNLGSAGINKVTGSDIPKLENSFMGSDWWKNRMGDVGVDTYDNIKDVPPSERGFSRAGEIFSAGSTSIFAPLSVAKSGKELTGTISKYFEPIVKSFRQNPKAAVATEVGMITGAAQGGGIAEMMFPENEYALFIGELTGSVVSPSAILSRSAEGTLNGLMRFANNFTEKGQFRQAGKDLKKAFEKMGYKQEDYLPLLSRELVIDTPLTAAQQTKFDGFILLENTLRRQEGGASFAKEADENIANAVKAIRTAVMHIGSSGKPSDLKLAAQLEQQMLKDIVESTTKEATEKASKSISALKGADKDRASVQFSDEVKTAIADLRKLEDGYWSNAKKAYGDPVETTTNTVQAINKIQSEFLTEFGEEGLPVFVQRFRNKATGEDIDVDALEGRELASATFGDNLEEASTVVDIETMIKLKRRMQEAGRVASANGNSNASRQFFEIADGVIEDLALIDNDAIKSATEFSRLIQDNAIKTKTAGIIRSTEADGSSTVRSPEVLDTLTSGTETSTKLNLAEADTITDLANTAKEAPGQLSNPRRVMSVESKDPFLGQMREPLGSSPQLDSRPMQEEYLQSLIAKKIDISDSLEPDAALTWVKNNEELINKFPSLRKKIETAAGDQQALKEIIDGLDPATMNMKDFLDKEEISSLLNYDDPVVAVRKMLDSPNPESGLDNLIFLADTPSMKEGLKTSIVEALQQKALAQNEDVFNISSVKQELIRPLVSKGDSLLEKMTKNGIMSKEESDRLMVLINEGEDLLKVAQSRYGLDEVPGSWSSALFGLITRVSGATIGGMSAIGQFAGTPLVAAGAGSTMMQQVMDKVPRKQTMKVLMEASKDPKIMRDMLDAAGTDNEIFERGKRLEAWLVGLNIIEATEAIDETEQMLFDEAI